MMVRYLIEDVLEAEQRRTLPAILIETNRWSRLLFFFNLMFVSSVLLAGEFSWMLLTCNLMVLAAAGIIIACCNATLSTHLYRVRERAAEQHELFLQRFEPSIHHRCVTMLNELIEYLNTGSEPAFDWFSAHLEDLEADFSGIAAWPLLAPYRRNPFDPLMPAVPEIPLPDETTVVRPIAEIDITDLPSEMPN